MKIRRLTYVGRFKASQFQFILNRGYRSKTYRADGIVAAVCIVSMWEVWPQQHAHTTPSQPLEIFPEDIRICAARLFNLALCEKLSLAFAEKLTNKIP